MIYIYVDASYKDGMASYGFTFQGGEKGPLFFARGGSIPAETNNTAEYMALYKALKEAVLRGKKRAVVRMDSELVVKQINGEYEVKDPKLVAIYRMIWDLIKKFDHIAFEHIPREQNKIAHGLAQDAMEEILESTVIEKPVEKPKPTKPKKKVSNGTSKGRKRNTRKSRNKS